MLMIMIEEGIYDRVIMAYIQYLISIINLWGGYY